MRSAMRNRLAAVRKLARTPRVTSDKEILEFASKMWSSLDTPLSLGLHLLVKNGQVEDALRVSIHPLRYQTASDYENDAQALAFLKKMPIKTDIDRRGAAWAKFLESEELCRQTNARFRNLREGNGCSPAVNAILHSTQWKIARWLGKFDARSWALRCRFGPGADLLTKKSCVSPYHKLSRLSATADFAESAVALALCHPPWARLLSELDPDVDSGGVTPIELTMQVVPGNKLTFVPKTALIDRSIAIEPRMNIYAQLGIGALIRSRLKRAGLDLDTQIPSQELAWIGSVDGTVATIDLSMASDTLATGLVRDLLPEPWFFAMDLCRSKVGHYLGPDGVEHTLQYQKFSSMGNGFTFELESMIFYALALSCAEATNQPVSFVRSFGDDIAIPSGAVALLEEVLAFCGFRINSDKSFSSGPFRESCGADFFHGKDVRPYFQKESLDSVQSLFRLANGLRRVAHRRNLGIGCDDRLKRVWDHVVRRLPASLRSVKGPLRLNTDRFSGWFVGVTSDDSYLACNLDEAMSSAYVRRDPDGRQGWLHAAVAPTGLRVSGKRGSMAEVVAWALYSCRDGSEEETSTPSDANGNSLIPLRGEGPRRFVSDQFSSDFVDAGPWI